MPDIEDAYVYYAWLASASIPGSLLLNLLKQYKSPEICYGSFCQDQSVLSGSIPERCIRTLSEHSTESWLRNIRKAMIESRISAFTALDADYPENLSCIQDPPAILFYQGNLRALRQKRLSIVGSRSASYAGQKATRKLARELSEKGITVISGMACGIDAAAHRGCLDAKGLTIAVTACGLDRVYPAEHLQLRNDILEHGGLLLSEYPPLEKPLGWHFPVRNRIITGLSDALILMEARIRSGSMTSVQHALDQGKDVFVYPGDPASGQYEGNHQLLREGAIYFTCAEDILSDLNWLDNTEIVRQNIDCSSVQEASTPEENAVIQAIKPGSLSFEQLISITGLSAPVLMNTLTIMQIKGLVETMPGKMYQLKS